VAQIHVDSNYRYYVHIFCFSGRKHILTEKKQLVQDLIPPPSNTHVSWFSPSGFFGLSRCLRPPDPFAHIWVPHVQYVMMNAFITLKSSWVPLIEGLYSSDPCRFELSVFHSEFLLFFSRYRKRAVSPRSDVSFQTKYSECLVMSKSVGFGWSIAPVVRCFL